MSTEDEQMAALVAADPMTSAPPDVVALRAGGRRLVRRRRAVVGAVAAAVVLAVAVPVSVAVGGDDAALDPRPATSPTGTVDGPSASATPTERSTQDRPPRPRRVDVPIGDGLTAAAEWEDREVVGAEVVVDTFGGHDRIIYATRAAAGGPDSAYVSVGLRYRGRIARLLTAISPERATGTDGRPVADGVELWGGGRREEEWVDGSPYYLVVGAVPGDVDVRVTGPDGLARPVTGAATDVLAGFTVFHDRGPWDPSWDELQPAPLTFDVGGGRSVEVRERSYES
jgi:hypothetical protein